MRDDFKAWSEYEAYEEHEIVLVEWRPDEVWAADITYVRLVRGFVYVAVLLDLFSRKVIGWALSGSLHAQLAVNALQHALRSRTVEPGLIHHSDRGVQYACQDYVQILQRHGIAISMSRKGNPNDSAKLGKLEKVSLSRWSSCVYVVSADN